MFRSFRITSFTYPLTASPHIASFRTSRDSRFLRNLSIFTPLVLLPDLGLLLWSEVIELSRRPPHANWTPQKCETMAAEPDLGGISLAILTPFTSRNRTPLKSFAMLNCCLICSGVLPLIIPGWEEKFRRMKLRKCVFHHDVFTVLLTVQNLTHHSTFIHDLITFIPKHRYWRP